MPVVPRSTCGVNLDWTSCPYGAHTWGDDNTQVCHAARCPTPRVGERSRVGESSCQVSEAQTLHWSPCTGHRPCSRSCRSWRGMRWRHCESTLCQPFSALVVQRSSPCSVGKPWLPKCIYTQLQLRSAQDVQTLLVIGRSIPRPSIHTGHYTEACAMVWCTCIHTYTYRSFMNSYLHVCAALRILHVPLTAFLVFAALWAPCASAPSA